MSSPIATAARLAREASRSLAWLTTDAKNTLLLDLASSIDAQHAPILAANELDLAAARASGLAQAKLARLTLTPASLTQLAEGLRQVAALTDPVGQTVKDYTVPSGLHVQRVRSPLGVICMIYEARPGVTVDAFALCFKAGNACILKGGKEAARSNEVLAKIVKDALTKHSLPVNSLTALTTIDRTELLELLQQDQYIDLVIPRGGEDLIRFVAQNSRIPTIQHYKGVNHLFVDESANLDMALKICTTAKVSAPATCNAAECVLVHRAVAERFVPRLAEACRNLGVQLRADAASLPLASAFGAVSAQPSDFGTEFLDLILALKLVNSLDDAISHIQTYGSNHSEAIITEDSGHARLFTQRVQASCVFVNTSTRMNDGYQLGLGAEIGISTTKIHAFGPMGLEELTTVRFVVHGDGQTR